MKEIFNQDKINELLDRNMILSMNIVCKVMGEELIVGESCLGDWLSILSDEELDMIIDYFNQIKGEDVKIEESEYLIAQDLLACLEFIYLVECNTSDGFNSEKLEDMLEFLDIACNLESIKREGTINIVDPPRLSDPNSGMVQMKKTGKKAAMKNGRKKKTPVKKGRGKKT
jgi:hypothetical protein